jgi:hypothetical protein
MNTITICIIAYCAICALITVFVLAARNTWKQCETREDKALFCPRCKSYNMGYQTKYIT